MSKIINNLLETASSSVLRLRLRVWRRTRKQLVRPRTPCIQSKVFRSISLEPFALFLRQSLLPNRFWAERAMCQLSTYSSGNATMWLQMSCTVSFPRQHEITVSRFPSIKFFVAYAPLTWAPSTRIPLTRLYQTLAPDCRNVERP